jgi:hypothetical protein
LEVLDLDGETISVKERKLLAWHARDPNWLDAGAYASHTMVMRELVIDRNGLIYNMTSCKLITSKAVYKQKQTIFNKI